MIEVLNFDPLFIKVILTYRQKNCGFVVTFVATGIRSWSFLTVSFKVFKPKKKEFIELYLYNFVS